MYTGIVMGVENIYAVEQKNGYCTIHVSNQQHFFDDVSIGASVAINGVCLTVTQIFKEDHLVSFDIGPVSLELTTLQFLQTGDQVNIERSFKMGMENGGHQLYGHIEGMAQIAGLEKTGDTLHLDINIPAEKMKYFFHKGFIGLHGCSLTVNRVDKTLNQISVDLIPETLRLTNLKSVQQGDFLNFEIDQTTRTLVDTIEGIYANRG
ncbi:riboflavin synthase [Acinetobacter qingfengensis]|uniref:Riboflavin synthase n=1 Tax=Acinetobacter qingfengensis TaxID=1262585 RepID=A0A1E7R5A0_9GAMM|nr:riboflavin synthase [Acinetobacter qingfengensis]KAA8732460.1 riboflavin synthase [Acinetobacter qingfengensis]OEY94455.1 riboflavin synthase subunit alpha [Acinetobacter qingfengensis]